MGLAGHGGPQELPPFRDRRVTQVIGLEQRNTPTRSRSDIATRPISCCCAIRRWSAGVRRAQPAILVATNEGFGDTFKQLFVDFYRSIETQEFKTQPSYPTFEDGHHEILVCEAIFSSHQQDRWVQIGE